MKRVIVVGAGIVGASTAYELSKAGLAVTLIDAEGPGSQAAASYGNGGWISPASIIPMSMPGLWRKVPSYLLDREGPLTIDWLSLPRLAPWLLRFVLAGCTETRARAIATQLNGILHDAPQRHLALAKAIGVPELVVQKGLLYAYPSREAFVAEGLSWQIRRDHGLAIEEWDAQTLAARIPALGPQFRFGAFVSQGAHCLNTGRYVEAIVQAAVLQGARLLQAKVTAVLGGASPRVTLQDGTCLNADYLVIAAGARSAKMLHHMGIHIPLESERGYHVTIPEPAAQFDIPIMPSTGKMANTPTQMGLRLSGQVELAFTDKPPNWRRAEVLRKHAWATYPALAAQDAPQTKVWMGHRPSTPDGMPVIGAFAREPKVIAAFGHGHIGIASGPITGDYVTQVILGRGGPAAALTPARFGA